MSLNNYINKVKNYRSFGLEVFLKQSCVEVIKYVVYTNRVKADSKINYLFSSIIKSKDRAIQNYISRHYSYIAHKYEEVETVASINTLKNIWLMWLQGRDKAPELVKKTINSIYKNKGNYDVIFLDEDNYEEYINVPTFIKEKYDKGIISPAHFSDYVRMSILAKYGGIWLDSTVFLFKELPNNYLEYPQYHAKGIVSFPFDYLYVDSHEWESYFLCGQKNSKFYVYMAECLETYWKENDIAIDYLFLNHFAKLGRERNIVFRKQWECIPENNIFVESLYGNLEKQWDGKEFKNDYEGTILFKLNHRHSIRTTDFENNLTIFGYLVSDNEELEWNAYKREKI